MSLDLIDVGTSANDGTGDPLRTAFQKTNSNLTEVYDTLATLNGNGPLGHALVSGSTAGDVAVTGIAADDTLASVLLFTAGALVSDLTSEFTITADDTINNTGGTNTTGSSLLVLWNGAVVAGGSLTGFTSSLEISSPNDTVNASVLQASGGTTDQDAIVSPKGDGAFQLQKADETAVGGNKRGESSVDLQMSRDAAASVAAGHHSFIGSGTNNAITDGVSYSAIVSGHDNSITTDSSNFIGAGGANTINSDGESFIGAGTGNTLNGDGQSFLGAGAQNVLNAERAFLGAGYGNVVDAKTSGILAGTQGNTRGIVNSEAFGIGVAGTTNGSFQRSHYGLGRVTADDTPAVLSSTLAAPAAENQITLPNSASYKFRGQIVAVDIATGDSSGWDFVGTIKRGANAASTALVAAVTPALAGQDSSLSATAIAVTADTTIGCLTVTVTGIADTDIQWMCDVMTSETTYGA